MQKTFILTIVGGHHASELITAEDLKGAIEVANEVMSAYQTVDTYRKVTDTVALFEGFGFNATLMQLKPED